jgi:hypothetical protein
LTIEVFDLQRPASIPGAVAPRGLRMRRLDVPTPMRQIAMYCSCHVYTALLHWLQRFPALRRKRVGTRPPQFELLIQIFPNVKQNLLGIAPDRLKHFCSELSVAVNARYSVIRNYKQNRKGR